MSKQFRKKSKLVAAMMSAAFVATAFTGPGGCTVTFDEGLFQDVLGYLEDYVGSGYVQAEWGSGPGVPGSQVDPCWEDDQDWSCPESGD